MKKLLVYFAGRKTYEGDIRMLDDKAKCLITTQDLCIGVCPDKARILEITEK